MITYFKRTLANKKLRKLDSFEIGCWIHVINPDEEELKNLAKDYDLDYDLLEEGIDPNELPRIDFEGEKNYIYTKTVLGKKKILGTLLMIISANFLLTISKEEPEALTNIILGKVKFVTTQKFKCVITILSLLNDKFERTVATIVKSVQSKKNTSDNLNEKDLQVFLQYEDFLNNLVSTYYYSSILYSKMIKKMKFYEEDKEELEDLIVESEEGLNLCRNSLKTITNIRNFYSIVLSNKLNRTITVLTIFTIMISIPAAISGIYGMNVILPFQDYKFAFIYVIAFIIILMFTFIYFLKKKEVI